MAIRQTMVPLFLVLLVGCPSTRADLVGVDEDGDGYGNWVDCDDNDAAVNPGETEEPYNGVDDDCDSDTPDDDLDGDGSLEADDCDDEDPNSHPLADEVCDGLDNDCDGTADNGVDSTWYADDDGDGFGDPETTDLRCDDGGGAWVHNDMDCDDTDEDIHPGALEVCGDDDDNDCDGLVNNNPVYQDTWYLDADGDGYGDPDTTLEACEDPSDETDTYVTNGDDCDDNTTDGDDVYPGAVEQCGVRDYNCDGESEAGITLAGGATEYFVDQDDDDYGDPDISLLACSQPTGFVANDDDCDDLDASINPDGTEVCNGLDDDCDTTPDNGATDTTTYYEDVDGDGYGDFDSTLDACTQPANYVTNHDDCDDNGTDGQNAHPGGTEVCDGLDNDCNGHEDDVHPDDDPLAKVWFLDDDDDGYGRPTDSVVACTQPTDYVDNNQDCNDGDSSIKPTANETCDGVDEDCDGLIDDGAAPLTNWYLDADGDDYGDKNATAVQACSEPSGEGVYVTDNTDCDDTDDTVNPGEDPDSYCDGLDHDCVDVAWADNDDDHDGYLDWDDCSAGLDCDDTNNAIKPGAGCGWGKSCWEALQNNPSFAGSYLQVDLDPDEDGTPTTYWCYMVDDPTYGPGWTELYWADFEVTSHLDGWSYWNRDPNGDNNESDASDWPAAVTTTNCPDSGTNNVLGGYNTSSEGHYHRQVSDEGIPHEEILVWYDYYRIDAWESNEDGFLRIEHDTTTAANQEEWRTWLWYGEIGADGDSELCGDSEDAGDYDETYSLSAHTWSDDDLFRIEFGATLDAVPTNESFAIDDVYIWVR